MAATVPPPDPHMSSFKRILTLDSSSAGKTFVLTPRPAVLDGLQKRIEELGQRAADLEVGGWVRCVRLCGSYPASLVPPLRFPVHATNLPTSPNHKYRSLNPNPNRTGPRTWRTAWRAIPPSSRKSPTASPPCRDDEWEIALPVEVG